ncbi:unnamed protein product [Thlaspi arvense]|uniref:Eukaryotic translation initiation factor 3 subunit G n=1 Tax=Thlaspi arvense TaxID=13288 RepID=A0AAU9S0N1_THLAR|nr:unnamed protein product [Thlaspi arvense]
MDWDSVAAEDVIEALREVEWSTRPRSLAEFFSRFAFPRSFSKWMSRLKCNLYYYRTNYFILLILVLGLALITRPLAILGAALLALSLAFLNDSFAATFNEKMIRTIRHFSPHLAAKMRPPHMPVIRGRSAARKTVYVCGQPRLVFVLLGLTASFVLWFTSCGLLWVLYALATALLMIILHASLRTPNLKARLNTFREEFRAVWPSNCKATCLTTDATSLFRLVDQNFKMTIDSQQQTSKFRWGEMEEDDDLDFLLPPRQVIGPDENGLKTVIEYKFNDEGNKVKITTRSRVRKLASARLNKRAMERRSWTKFGDAANEDAGSRLTMVSTEEILMERPRAPGTKADDTKAAGDSLSQLGKGGAVLMVCRICHKKGDHWTSKCPYKDLAPPTDVFVDKPTTGGETATTSAASGIGKAAYVPPSRRDGADRTNTGTDMRRRNDENSVRVTNLSEDTREPDLMELFHPFGAVTRVYVAIDQKTGVSRGFGFVNFVTREDAQRAINKLNGYGYDNLILRVEWATPRPT